MQNISAEKKTMYLGLAMTSDPATQNTLVSWLITEMETKIMLETFCQQDDAKSCLFKEQ